MKDINADTYLELEVMDAEKRMTSEDSFNHMDGGVTLEEVPWKSIALAEFTRPILTEENQKELDTLQKEYKSDHEDVEEVNIPGLTGLSLVIGGSMLAKSMVKPGQMTLSYFSALPKWAMGFDHYYNSMSGVTAKYVAQPYYAWAAHKMEHNPIGFTEWNETLKRAYNRISRLINPYKKVDQVHGRLSLKGHRSKFNTRKMKRRYTRRIVHQVERQVWKKIMQTPDKWHEPAKELKSKILRFQHQVVHDDRPSHHMEPVNIHQGHPEQEFLDRKWGHRSDYGTFRELGGLGNPSGGTGVPEAANMIGGQRALARYDSREWAERADTPPVGYWPLKFGQSFDLGRMEFILSITKDSQTDPPEAPEPISQTFGNERPALKVKIGDREMTGEVAARSSFELRALAKDWFFNHCGTLVQYFLCGDETFLDYCVPDAPIIKHFVDEKLGAEAAGVVTYWFPKKVVGVDLLEVQPRGTGDKATVWSCGTRLTVQHYSERTDKDGVVLRGNREVLVESTFFLFVEENIFPEMQDGSDAFLLNRIILYEDASSLGDWTTPPSEEEEAGDFGDEEEDEEDEEEEEREEEENPDGESGEKDESSKNEKPE